MAAKKKTRRRPAPRRRGKQSGGGFWQRVLVGVAGVVLVLCVASITQGFFFRNASTPPDGLFRIEVLNGTGKAGLAQAVKRGLLRKGIDVIEAGNASTFDHPESILIARKPGADVETLGKILGCSRIISQHKDKTLADATLILGDDYRELNLDWQLESDLLE